MRPIHITCDSTCDLSPKLYADHNITPIALGVTLGETLYHDGVDIASEDLYHYVEETGTLPKTSAASVGEYIDFFTPFVKEGNHVIHISLSNELSVSHHNACMAAQELGDVTVIDSRSLSTGSGHLALLAAELAKSGMDSKEITEIVTEASKRLDVSFVVDTLDYLHKGGRCSGVAKLGANLLKLHPEIKVTDGEMTVGKKYRGTMDHVVEDYIRSRLEDRDDISLHRIFITHSGVSDKILDRAVALVKQLHPFEEVLVTKAGSTICTHCGPGTLGVLFFKKDNT